MLVLSSVTILSVHDARHPATPVICYRRNLVGPTRTGLCYGRCQCARPRRCAKMPTGNTFSSLRAQVSESVRLPTGSTGLTRATCGLMVRRGPMSSLRLRMGMTSYNKDDSMRNLRLFFSALWAQECVYVDRTFYVRSTRT